MVGLQDSLYSVYNPQYQFVPDISSVTVAVSAVPELYQLQEDTVTLTIPDQEDQPGCEDYRLAVLARTWTTDLARYLESQLWTDTDIRCAGGETLSAHRVMLAAASPLLASCLNTSLELEERATILIPDFSYQEVKDFLEIVYLSGREESSSYSNLLEFLTQFECSDISEIKTAEKTDKVEQEEKVKKFPEEVKMEVSQENNSASTSSEKKAESSQPEKKGNHTCDKCGKTFKLVRVLKEHMNIHGEPKFHCDFKDCNRKFHLKANLKAHRDVVHLKCKTIPCEICGKMFYNQANLRSLNPMAPE